VVEIQSQVYGHVLRSSHNLRVHYSYCSSFFIRDVHGKFGLVNVHFFEIMLAVSSGKVWGKSGIFSGWRAVTL